MRWNSLKDADIIRLLFAWKAKCPGLTPIENISGISVRVNDRQYLAATDLQKKDFEIGVGFADKGTLKVN